MRKKAILIMLLFTTISIVLVKPSEALFFKKKKQQNTLKKYLDYFEEVYNTINDNYYQPVSRDAYNQFIIKFKEKIFEQLKATGKTDDYVKWRSAALLVDDLKTQEDIFSAFYPPEPAKEYEQTALGVRIDLGVEGRKIDKGFVVTHVEPRSDAFAKGLRPDNLILMIDEQSVIDLPVDKIKDLLRPLAETSANIRFFNPSDSGFYQIDVVSKEFFKQTVFEIPIPIEGIHGLEIQRFNRSTGEDMFRFIKQINSQGNSKGLILDLRGNPGGPPLAAREISSFFLPGGDEFAYFQMKEETVAKLDVPKIPEDFKYDQPIVILLNKDTGSASELFSGVLQSKGRAVIMGQNSAGQVMLKSMFHMKDKSMVLLVTARGHHPDGKVFSFNGITPDRFIPKEDEDNLLKYAATYLLYMSENSH